MDKLSEIKELMQQGRSKNVFTLVQEALDEGIEANVILNDALLAGMAIIGDKFKQEEIFVPEVLVAARAMNKGVEVLKPYLPILLGFLKDLNWPGSPIILERLQNFTRTEWLCTEFQESVKIAKAIDDHMWLIWLAELLDNEKLKEMLPDEMLEFLKDYYHSCWD